MYLAIFFIVLGLAFTVLAAYITQLGHAANSWPSVTARKLRDGIENSRTKSGETYSAGYFMIYEYTVNGEKFTGSNISFSPKSPSERRYDGEKYKDAIEVTAYYNPKMPQISVLEPGINKRNFLMMFMGVAFVLIGTAFLVFDI